MHSLTSWSKDPKKREIGEILGENMHRGIESSVKILFAASLSPEDTGLY